MPAYEKEYRRLNPAQRRAVDHIDGPLLVVAGPGTGKTQLLSARVGNILKKTDVDPQNILCITFTEAAARNMRERLSTLIGQAAYHVGIYTFHGFGSDIIQRYPEHFEDRPLQRPVEELGAYEILRAIFRSLPHGNPLSLTIGEDFLHLFSTLQAISWLKQAGIEPQQLRHLMHSNKAFIDYAEPLVQPVFQTPPSPKQKARYQKLLKQLRAYRPKDNDASLAELCVTELEAAIDEIDPKSRYAKSITVWRNRWLVQNRTKRWLLTDRRKNKLTMSVAGVYERFQKQLDERGLYTFDDMILRTLTAIKKHDELRFSLQERYQYILVDEYQDTNGAQNQLIELIADSPVNEGRPNLMVVGDDDQAIYRFQGAHLSIMLDFVQRWRGVTKIVLTENYRSNQAILDLARYVILQGKDRLESTDPELKKDLFAANTNPKKAFIKRPESFSELEQYQYVTEEIQRLVKQGAKPSSLAVMAPKHSYLQALVPYLIKAGLPLRYERREHILEQPRIVELLDLAAVVVAAGQGEWRRVDELLPTVLAAPYWQIPASTIYQLSLEAFRSRQFWLELLLTHKNPRLRGLSKAVIELSKLALSQPAEITLDQLIGNAPVRLESGVNWRSAYKQFYFNERYLAEAPGDYLKLLGQLASLRERLRSFRPEQRLTLQDLLDFTALYRQSRLTLLDTSPHNTSADAVELLTAYKAKGLEWDSVFLLGVHEDIWGTRAKTTNYSLGIPTNLAWIKPARDSADDRLRLFYVAMTRAKSRLYLSSYKQYLSGRATEPLNWLSQEDSIAPAIEDIPPPKTAVLIDNHETHWRADDLSRGNLKETLLPYLQNYSLSATHLNDFLDLTRGGPRNFMLRHILHFPQTLPPSSLFGSAMHATLHFVHHHLQQTGRRPPLKKAQQIFRELLQTQPLTAEDQKRLSERGQVALQRLLQATDIFFLADDVSEYDFAREGARLGDIRLTGKVDVIRKVANRQHQIIDYKTGAALTSWRPRGTYPQIRARLYQHQLALYRRLVEGSTRFGQSGQVDRLTLHFVEPTEEGDFVQLDFQPSPEEEAYFNKLVEAIWQHVMNSDFPDTSHYSLDIKGLLAFEEDLINEQI